MYKEDDYELMEDELIELYDLYMKGELDENNLENIIKDYGYADLNDYICSIRALKFDSGIAGDYSFLKSNQIESIVVTTTNAIIGCGVMYTKDCYNDVLIIKCNSMSYKRFDFDTDQLLIQWEYINNQMSYSKYYKEGDVFEKLSYRCVDEQYKDKWDSLVDKLLDLHMAQNYENGNFVITINTVDGNKYDINGANSFENAGLGYIASNILDMMPKQELYSDLLK